MAKIISSVTDRDALKPRREPYWHKLEKGCYLGFRKMTATTEGAWLARFRDEAAGKQKVHALGKFDELPPGRRFDAAQKAARDWLAHMGRGGISEKLTVKEACERYIKHLRAEKREAAAEDAEARFRRHLDTDKLGALDVQKLNRRHLTDWKQRLAAKPAPISRAKDSGTKERSKAALNRDMAVLRAALNFAHRAGYITTDDAWKTALTPAEDATRRRDVYLDPEQRRQLIGAAAPDMGRFLLALNSLPLRPGALAGLKVRDFDSRLKTLRIPTDKAGAGRTITLPDATAQFFEECAKNKLPAAPLLARADGKPWSKDAWKKPIKDAVIAAGLPATATAYTLRHSVITDLVSRHGLDLSTVATLAGTSIEMIQAHYAHLRQDHARDALAKLAAL